MALHDGHRKRMYEKAEKGILAEHEWLEVLLFNAIPRRNTNEIAHELINRFGSAGKVFFATAEELQKVPGVGANVAAQILAIGHFFEKYNERKEITFDKEFESKAFIPFVKDKYKGIVYEVLDIYLLDGEGYIEKHRRFSIQSIASVKIVPEEISSFILTQGVSGVVMVHNHPFGDAAPSEADDTLTKNCQLLCSMNNRLLCDHFIHGKDGVFSYYLNKKMERISRDYSVHNVLG